MIKVNIGKTKWQIPERLTVDEWVRLQKWDFTVESHWPWIIHEIASIDVEEFEGADPDSMKLFIGFMIGAVNKRTQIDYKAFDELNFGQFVDLDCFLAAGVEKSLVDILEVLEVTTPWADEALLIVEQFIKWRSIIFKQYKTLFNLDNNEDSVPVEEKEFDPKQVARGWYNVIVDLAGDDILKMDQITEEPLQKCLTFLQIKKEKALAEAQEARKIRNKQR